MSPVWRRCFPPVMPVSYKRASWCESENKGRSRGGWFCEVFPSLLPLQLHRCFHVCSLLNYAEYIQNSPSFSAMKGLSRDTSCNIPPTQPASPCLSCLGVGIAAFGCLQQCRDHGRRRRMRRCRGDGEHTFQEPFDGCASDPCA